MSDPVGWLGTPLPDGDYSEWVRLYGGLNDADRAAIRAHIRAITFCPRFSILLEAGADESALAASISSLVGQLYTNFEVCCALGHAETELTSRLLDLLGGDSRTRIVRVPGSTLKSPVARRNAALHAATGDFVLCLDAGDRLAEHALVVVAAEIASSPKAAVIYSDEDRLNAEGRRYAPRFKNGWDPDLMLSHDMLGRLAVFRRDLALSIGGFRAAFEGAEEHDFALRATARPIPFQIRHLPEILYHRGALTHRPNSPLTRRVDASRRAVRAFLDEAGHQTAQVRPNPLVPHWHRVVWPIRAPAPLVSIIVPTRDRPELLRNCAEGVLRHTDYQNIELLIVDNDSVEADTLALFAELSADLRVRILHCPDPFNFSALTNLGARESRGEILLLLNNDIEVIEDGWLREIVSQALRPDVGAVGAKLLYADGRIQHGGVILGPGLSAAHALRLLERSDVGYLGQGGAARSLLAVTAACLAVRRSVFEELNGLDEVNLPVSFNDVDFCLRIGDRGYRIVWTPFAELFHLESASRGHDTDRPEKQARARRELEYLWTSWSSLFEADPFHNPNLLVTWDHPVQLTAPRRTPKWAPAPIARGTA